MKSLVFIRWMSMVKEKYFFKKGVDRLMVYRYTEATKSSLTINSIPESFIILTQRYTDIPAFVIWE